MKIAKVNAILLFIFFVFFSIPVFAADDAPDMHPRILLGKLEDRNISFSNKLDMLEASEGLSMKYNKDELGKIKRFLHKSLVSEGLSLDEKKKCLKLCHAFGLIPSLSDEIVMDKSIFKQEPEFLYSYLLAPRATRR